MNRLIDAVGKLFDLLVGLLGGSPPLVMLVVSVITAVWALLLFKAVTPQDRLTAVRDRLFGHIYEMGMYQEHLRVVGRIQGDLARANLRYLSLTLPALVVLTVPMIFTLAQLDSRYAHRPFRVDEATVLSVTLAADQQDALDRITLEAPPGVVVEAGPVRDRSAGALAWRLRAGGQGTHRLRILDGGLEIGSRELVVGDGLIRLGETGNQGLMHRILYPGSPPLPRDGPLQEMTLRLPARHTKYMGVEMSWLPAFMVFSLLAGLVLKDFLRVSI